MVDLFKEKAQDWDSQPLPIQISEGVFDAITAAVELGPDLTVLDFGAGTGLVCTKLAPLVQRVLAVDISEAMLNQLAEKAELRGKVEVICQNILESPLDEAADLVVSAMAMHHVEDTRALLCTLFDHLAPGGRVALADLDTEAGDFHPADIEGVYHNGFDRVSLGSLMIETGFLHPEFVTACTVNKEGRNYPIFLLTASKAG